MGTDIVKFEPVGKCATKEAYEAAIQEASVIVQKIEELNKTRDSSVLLNLYDLGKIVINRIGSGDDMKGEQSVNKFCQDIKYSDLRFSIMVASRFNDETIKTVAARSPTLSALREILQVADSEQREKLITKICLPEGERPTVRETRGEIKKLVDKNPEAVTKESRTRRDAVEKTKKAKAAASNTPIGVCGAFFAKLGEVIELGGSYCLIEVGGLSKEDAKNLLEMLEGLDNQQSQTAEMLDDLRKTTDRLGKELQAIIKG